MNPSHFARRVILPSILLFVMLAMVPAIAADNADQPQPVDLRPVWRTGQTSQYHVVTERATTVEIVGYMAPKTVTQTISGDFTWEVVRAHDDGSAECKLTILSLSFTETGPDGQTVTMDGSGSDNPEVQQFFKAFQNAVLTFTVTSDGLVGSVTGGNRIRTDAGEAGESLEDRDLQEMATELAPLAGGAADQLPGAQWSQSFDWSHRVGSLLLDTTFTYQGVEAVAGIPLATIATDSKVNIKPKDPDPSIKSSIQLVSGEHHSQIFFDLSRHEVVGRNIDQSLEIKGTFKRDGQTIVQRMTEQLNTQVLRTSESQR